MEYSAAISNGSGVARGAIEGTDGDDDIIEYRLKRRRGGAGRRPTVGYGRIE